MAFLGENAKKQMIARGINQLVPRAKMLGATVLDLILPPKCLKCSARVDRAHNICPDCWKDLHFISKPLCACCGYPFSMDKSTDLTALGETLCGVCQKGNRSFDRALSALRYDDQSRKMIIGFKHQDRLEYARYFTKLLKTAGAELFPDVDIIMPVPLHQRRLLKRRYNQSAVLSSLLASDLSLNHAPEMVERIKNTPPQQGNINKRSKNVRGAFKVVSGGKERLKGKTILLIDDVYTTGATAENCARVLKRAGAGKVYILTVFRVVSAQKIK